MELSAQWIWAAEVRANAYCHLRRRFEVAGVPMQARLRISADTNYMVWLNGRYIGQGPGPYVRERRPVDEYDVTDLLQAGANVICVLGNWWGVTSHSRPKGDPGVLAELVWEDAEGQRHRVATDQSWRAILSEAWEEQVPRRSGAVAWTEYYDARREPVDWMEADFEDAGWPAAQAHDGGGRTLFPRHRPLLREWSERPVALVGAWHASADSPGPADTPELTEVLDDEPLEPLAEAEREALEEGLLSPGPHVLELRPGEGLALTLDLGREIVGHLELDIEATEGGRIDLAPAELLRDGRPWCFRKGCRYGQRYVTREGRQRWRTYGWHGLRYLHVVLRGFEGPVTIHQLGVSRREADLDWRAEFASEDDTLQRVWEIGVHTLRVSTQEVHVDCPTREQAAYWGDAAWIGAWTLAMTGNCSHLRHLLLSAEPAQYPDGQLPASIFSSLDQILLDYTLIMPWALREWWWLTGDLTVPRRLDAVVGRVLNWYRERIGESGLIEIDGVESRERGEGTLFIDHPGLGWHNFPHPGLERRGISAGLNLLMLRALQCRAEVLGHVGHADRARLDRREATELAAIIERTFFDPERGVYVDALVDGRQSEQVSQQINTLAVLTGVCPPERRRPLLERVLADDPAICRCSPYFWLYQFDAMAQAGMHEEMLGAIRSLWGEMAEAGATTWWETFGGDHLDSLCHPWSSAPGYVIQTHILGIRPAEPGFARAIVAPRWDLLEQARGSLCTVRGDIEVGWRRSGGSDVEVTVVLPPAIAATVTSPPEWRFDDGLSERQMAAGTAMVARVARA